MTISVEKFVQIRYTTEWYLELSEEEGRTQHGKNIMACNKALEEYLKKDRPLNILAVYGSGRSSFSSCANELSNSQMLLLSALQPYRDNPEYKIEDVALREYNNEPCNNSCWVKEKILTGQGWKSLESLSTDAPDVLDGTNRWNAPVRYFSHMEKEVFRVETIQGYEVHLTAEHEVYLADGTKKEVRDLRIGDRVALVIPNEPRFGSKTSLPEFTSLKYARVSNAPTPKHWTEELAEAVGYIIGDGHFTSSGKYLGLSFGVDDQADGRRICEVLRQLSGADGHENLYIQPTFVGGREGVSTCYQFRLGSRNFVSWLRSIGVVKTNSHDADIPETLWEAPQNIIAAFLKGLYATDGSVSVNTGNDGLEDCAISLASTSQSLVKNVQRLLLQFGIRSTMTRPVSKNNPCWQLVIYSADGVEKFRRYIGFGNTRKQERLAAYNIPTKELKPRSWARVSGITSIGVQRIADIEMPVDHSFTAGGIRISNCYAASSALCGFPCNCFVFDPMQQLYPKVLACDVMLCATGVNQSAMSSRLKIFLDRLISLDGGFYISKKQFAYKDAEWRDKCVKLGADLAEKDALPYDARMWGKTAAYFIASKDEKNTQETVVRDYKELSDLSYIQKVADSLREGNADYGFRHHPEDWYAGVWTDPNQEMCYDKDFISRHPEFVERAKHVVASTIELAKTAPPEFDGGARGGRRT